MAPTAAPAPPTAVTRRRSAAPAGRWKPTSSDHTPPDGLGTEHIPGDQDGSTRMTRRSLTSGQKRVSKR